MRRNKLVVFLHCVWATWDRLPLITPDVERRLHRNIESEARQLGCDVLALNGMPDHVHVLVKFPSTLTIAELLKQMKGVSSNFANEELFKDKPTPFKWQGGYAAFSVSRWDVDKIISYINRQKEHHAAADLWPEYEETYEEVEASQ